MDWRVAVYQLPVPSDLFPKILAFHDPVYEHVSKKFYNRVAWCCYWMADDEYEKLLKDAWHVIRTAETVEKLDELF